ncbi:uncharacterized protein DSM5745_04340 [Aspergillus mulundensis]|uniref:Uncharacterized protein n=1 Tax=Aspergillus mulundensis TaxID=1810919 RepID=A0A3D8SD51_9EURO|nr:hypothetical protein DSM5745_04340 [Aspergillus mulundensis]RDW84014.1 hypothetical protein DSM5745_04340 [Aspergillus mulundensis]
MPTTTPITPTPAPKVYIGDLNKLNLLHALWRCSHPLLDHPDLPTQPVFNKELALRAARETDWTFTYVQGRLIRADLAGAEADPSGYDAWNGQGSFRRIAVGVSMLGADFEGGLARAGLARARLVGPASGPGSKAAAEAAGPALRFPGANSAASVGNKRGQKGGFRRRVARFFA